MQCSAIPWWWSLVVVKIDPFSWLFGLNNFHYVFIVLQVVAETAEWWLRPTTADQCGQNTDYDHTHTHTIYNYTWSCLSHTNLYCHIQDEAMFDQVFQQANFKEYIFKVRAKMDSFNVRRFIACVHTIACVLWRIVYILVYMRGEYIHVQYISEMHIHLCKPWHKVICSLPRSASCAVCRMSSGWSATALESVLSTTRKRRAVAWPRSNSCWASETVARPLGRILLREMPV